MNKRSHSKGTTGFRLLAGRHGRSAMVGLLGLLVALGYEADFALGQWATSGNDIYNSNAGAVGIGTSTPGAKVEFANRGAFAFRLRDSANGKIWDFVVGSPTSNLLRLTYGTGQTTAIAINDSNGGRVGIGTTDPETLLHVKGNAKFESGVSEVLTVKSTTSAANVIFQTSAGQSGEFTANANGLQFNAPLPGNDIYFRTQGTNPVVFKSGGTVGIGTETPNASYKLHVAGSVKVDGNIAAKYQDVAEWVPASRPISPATVVVLDPQRSNHVLPSLRPYDTSVAGVISAIPGILLGEGGDGKVMVATTGRVKVKVDASGSAIRVGDLLVTGDKEGTAMKSQPVDVAGIPMHRPGTLIGKALEPLAKGEGEILVLLSLH